MLKYIFNLLKNTDRGLISKIKSLSHDEYFILNLKQYLKKEKFLNIGMCDGEGINIKDEISNNCCLDIYFEKEYLYMLTIFEDGIILLKNKNRVIKDSRGHSLEEIDYEEIFRLEEENQILSSLRILLTLETEFDFLELYEKGFFIIPEFSIKSEKNPNFRTIFNKIEDDFAKYSNDLRGNLSGLKFYASRDINVLKNIGG